MKISDLYMELCRLYAISNVMDIDDFVVGATQHADGILIGNSLPDREALFVKDGGDGATEIGLFISPDILRTIDESSPLEKPDEFSCAVEGVSHFLYICDRIEKDMPVTTLELELQGEVDKFLFMAIASERAAGCCPPDLFDMQFEKHRFDPHLSPNEREKYMAASRLAAKYCNHMLSRHFNPLRMKGLIRDARDFFVRDFKGKIERLTP